MSSVLLVACIVLSEDQVKPRLPTTEVGVSLPDWLGTWFAIFPNVEGLVAQAGAALVVIGSYLVVERKKRSRRLASETANT